MCLMSYGQGSAQAHCACSLEIEGSNPSFNRFQLLDASLPFLLIEVQAVVHPVLPFPDLLTILQKDAQTRFCKSRVYLRTTELHF